MPWWTCFNCANVRTQQNNNTNDIRVLDFSHHLLQDVPSDVFQYERMLEELYLNSNRVSKRFPRIIGHPNLFLFVYQSVKYCRY